MEGIYNKVEELLEDINKQIADIKKEITEYCEKNIKQLSLEIEKAKGTKTGRVPEGENYWFISNDWDFAVDLETETNSIDDDYLYDIGNYFRTEEEAKKALEKVQIYTRLKRFAEENNKHEIDWDNKNEIKYGIKYDCDDKCLYASNFYRTKNMCLVYFTSKKIAEQAIQEIGEENIKKLFD